MAIWRVTRFHENKRNGISSLHVHTENYTAISRKNLL